MRHGLLDRIEVAAAGNAVTDSDSTAASNITKRAEPFAAVANIGLEDVVLIQAPTDQRQRGEEISGTGGRRGIQQFPGHDKIWRAGPRGNDPEVADQAMVAELDAEPRPF